MEEESTEVKIIFVGNSNVGKTSIATRYVSGTFSNDTEATVGAAFLSKDVDMFGVKCTFNIWDTAGQEAYRYLVPMYYRNAAIAVIVFDLSQPASFDACQSWIDDVKANIGDDIVFLLCGNKCDLDKAVEFDRIQELEKQTGIIYVETSAATGDGISKLFEISLSEYLKKLKNQTKETSKGISVTPDKNIKNEKSGCC